MTNEAGGQNTALIVPTRNGGAESINVDEIIRRRLEATPKGKAKSAL